MTDRRRRTAPSDTSAREDNPFAPPPEGTPDQPWQPRRPADGQGGGKGTGGSGDGGNGNDGEGSDGRSSWGSQWSSRQPGRQSGGFGRPGGEGDGQGPGGPGPGRGLRWDPTDPMQRRARYALHSGIWALFFALFSLPPVALLLGALSLYWGISSLRARNRAGAAGAKDGTEGRASGGGTRATAEDVAGSDRSATSAPHPAADERSEAAKQLSAQVAVTPAQAAKAQATAAISGLVTASLGLVVVAATFTVQLVYSDYYTCRQDALTQTSRDQCENLLPENLRPLLEQRTPE
ncbi:hypothetical protein [Streptomyces sp. HNM0574]|uniref:hypothetical protein n=1 Tax=Streptomyces sp. HNM0574 TaxID=2714954 RepID=UPI00146D98AD|nr:hypothetical protein [Streptomyces sp. HNM0574]NLU66834.1 hypothetical protein [Streptomyces sp. HNM0574]